MGRPKDKRVIAKRGSQDLAGLVNSVMTGQRVGRTGAEHHGFEAIKALVQVFLVGEGSLADELRAFVACIMDKSDTLRADIPPEVWAALFPTLNSLVHARRQAERTLAQLAAQKSTQEAAHGEGEGRSETGSEAGGEVRSETSPTQHAGSGSVGSGAGVAGEVGEGGGR